MVTKILLLIMMSFSVAVGGFWALQAQDPAPQSPRTDPPVVSAQTMQMDLSGTYTGTFDCEALGLIGDTTLTITGNEFTTADGKTGRIVTSTTGGYTAVALQVGGIGTGAATTATTPATPPVIVSLRARKRGNQLTLTSAPGTMMKCSFVPARGRRTPRTPAATGTEVTDPATVPVPTPTESPIPSQTPSPSPAPSPTVSPTPTPSPTPSEPVPTPSPDEPTPSPTPGEPMPTPTPGEPTPSPTPGEPTPSPSPTPTPSPSPRP